MDTIEATPNKYEMEFLGKSRKKVKPGDVFAMKIKGYDVYFYGKVIADDANYFGANIYYLTFTYKTPTDGLIIPEDLDENDILYPLITDRSGWGGGMFKTLCNIPVKESEVNADYGFHSPSLGQFISSDEVEIYSQKSYEILDGTNDRIMAIPYADCYYNILDHKPTILRERHTLSMPLAFETEISAYLCRHPEIREQFGIE